MREGRSTKVHGQWREVLTVCFFFSFGSSPSPCCRSEAHRQELPPPVGQLPPPGPPPRPHHRRRGAPHRPAPRAVGHQVVAHRQEPPRPDGQRDQELLEDAHQEEGARGEAARRRQDGDGGVASVLLCDDGVLLPWLSDHAVLVGSGIIRRFSAAGRQRQRQRRRRRRARGGVDGHCGEPAPAAAGVLLHHGPAVERDRGSRCGGELRARRLGSRWPLLLWCGR
uniref:Uncharacterized protein n=1 Tax=Setaria viridis TaxID=4556 RepID=A0A4U6VK42_SETVI|nr:hypothetical protein SEVIR_3G062932v2 [Setaria viridis]